MLQSKKLAASYFGRQFSILISKQILLPLRLPDMYFTMLLLIPVDSQLVAFQFVCLGCDLQFKDQSNLRLFS